MKEIMVEMEYFFVLQQTLFFRGQGDDFMICNPMQFFFIKILVPELSDWVFIHLQHFLK